MSARNSFLSPPPLTRAGDYSFASNIQYGSQQNISWTDDYEIPVDLVLVQETAWLDNNTLSPQLDTIASNLTTESYTWDSKPTQDRSLSDLFWLALYNSSDYSQGPLIASQYFNVTSSASSSSIPSSSSSTASPSSTTSSSTSSSSSSTPAAQPSTTPTGTTTPASSTPSSTPKSTSNNAALGAGLGAGLGGAALILAAVTLFFFIRRKRQNRNGRPGRPEVYQLAENDTFSH